MSTEFILFLLMTIIGQETTIIYLNMFPCLGHNRSSYPGGVQRSGWRPAARGSVSLRLRPLRRLRRPLGGGPAGLRAQPGRSSLGPRRRQGRPRRGLRPQPSVLLRL